jgi:hypothetical protein
MSRRTPWVALALMLGALACSDRTDDVEAPYAPDLGELMTLTQLRHAKLYFAAESSNWELAAYELKELGEGLEDAVRFHPDHDGQPIAALLPVHMNPPIEALGAAIDAREPVAFAAAYDRLTAACNGCHETAKVGFIRIVRPTSVPFTNQDFTPAAAP